MNIGFEAKRLFCNFTGLGNYARTTVANLQSHFPEHNYHLYTPRVRDNPRTTYFQSNDFHVHLPSSKRPFWRQFGIVNDLAKANIDIYHGLSAELPIGLKLPSVVTIHDLIFETHPHQYNWIDSKIYSQKAKYACKNASKVIAISEATKEDIIRYYGIKESKIEVLYQACDPSFYEAIPNTAIEKVRTQYQLPQSYLLYVGTIIERKNLITIIEALELSQDEEVNLVVIGAAKSPYAQGIKQHVANSAYLTRHVHFLENVPFADFPAIYKAAELFIYPSDYEGFGIPVLEAQAIGTPVITSNRSSLKEAGGKHSLLLDDINAHTIAEAIKSLRSNPERCEQMVQAGYEYIQKFDKTTLSEQLMKLYQELV